MKSHWQESLRKPRVGRKVPRFEILAQLGCSHREQGLLCVGPGYGGMPDVFFHTRFIQMMSRAVSL